MNAGKTTVLLQTAHNYEERGQKVLIIKSAIDTKGKDKIMTRIGLTRKVDKLIKKENSIITQVKNSLNKIACILVDEAQFLSTEQVDDLFFIAKHYDVPVIAFGFRTDFQQNGFEGAIRLLCLADSLEEMSTICRCGKKARFNGRLVNGCFQKEGDSIVIDNQKEVTYEALCGTCYIEKFLK